MSIHAVSLALKSKLPTAQKFVLVALSQYANDDGTCWPSQESLARDTSMTDRTVRAHLAKLENEGIISRERRNNKRGQRTSDYITIHRKNIPVEDQPTGNSRPSLPEGDSGESSREPSPLPNGKGYMSEPDVFSDEIDQAVHAWNAFAGEYRLSVVQKLTKSRLSKLKARLKDCGGIHGWQCALKKVTESDFLLGANKDGWKANFDFMLREDKFTKLMEDGYAGTKQPASDGGDYRADILAGLGLSGDSGECASGDGGSGAGQGAGIAETGDGSGVRGGGGTAVQVGADVRPDSREPSGRGGILPASNGGDTGGPGGGGGVECHADVEVGQQDAPAERSAGSGAGRVHAAPGGIVEYKQGDSAGATASVIDLDVLRRMG